jgi:hypothetical protein
LIILAVAEGILRRLFLVCLFVALVNLFWTGRYELTQAYLGSWTIMKPAASSPILAAMTVPSAFVHASHDLERPRCAR